MADAPARAHAIVNPERCAACLRRLVEAWDGDKSETFLVVLREARQLLGVREPVERAVKR